MCNILFRAKAINRDKGYHKTKYKNGDWVYGLVTRLYDERFENLPAEMTDINGVSGIEVDYKTIGQYTGLTDKNGVRIFEGDIVRATIERAERCQSPRIENGVIGYDCIGMIGLILYKDKNGENVWSDFFNELSLSGLIEDYYFEIIGNIHDNPEILKGGEENG